MTTTLKPIQLTARDLVIVRQIATYKFLSTFQLHAALFPTAQSYRTATKRLTTLTKGGILSRLFTYPKATDSPTGHPTAIYYYSPANHAYLQRLLEAQGQASTWEDYKHLATTDNHDDKFSRFYLTHELGISDFFLTLEASCKQAGLTIPFWERTSPFSKDIRDWVDAEVLIYDKHGNPITTTKRVAFNPDAFFCLKDQDATHLFFFLEYDNNTAPVQTYRKKLSGYIAQRKDKRFPDLLARYVKKYQLPITTTKNAGFRVLTITPDERRRNALFLDALALKSYKMLWFASMTDITPATALTAIYLRGKEYAPISQKEKVLSRELTKALKWQWQTDQLAAMPRVSLLD